MALTAERQRTAERRAQAASEGILRSNAYARELRLKEVAAALAAVPLDRWHVLGDWLSRNALGLDTPPIIGRPRDVRGSWVSAEADALRHARSELERAQRAIAEGLSFRGLDAEGLTTGSPRGADLLGRLGTRYIDAVEAAERALADVAIAARLLEEEPEEVGEADGEDWSGLEPFGETAPGDGRHPATRAFPELLRFWIDEAGRDRDQRELFLLFARAALVATAHEKRDSPAEWTTGLDEAFKRR